MTRVFLGLGANIGDRRANLELALRWLEPRCRVISVSSLYRSAAVVAEGQAPGPDFFNAACEVETELPPGELLTLAKSIERAIGRRPAERWAPRPIDIDILLYGDAVIDAADLVVPHPLMGERPFVLVPLAEIAADVTHPVLAMTVGDLAAEDDLEGLEHVAGPGWAGARFAAAGEGRDDALMLDDATGG